MLDKPVLIRKNTTEAMLGVVMLAGIILAFVIGQGDQLRAFWLENPGSSLLISAVVLAIFVGITIHSMSDEPEMILSNEGIEIRDRGYRTWDQIVSFSIVRYWGSDYDELVIHLHDLTDLRYVLDSLDHDKDQLVAALLKAKGDYPITYSGYFNL